MGSEGRDEGAIADGTDYAITSSEVESEFHCEWRQARARDGVGEQSRRRELALQRVRPAGESQPRGEPAQFSDNGLDETGVGESQSAVVVEQTRVFTFDREERTGHEVGLD